VTVIALLEFLAEGDEVYEPEITQRFAPRRGTPRPPVLKHVRWQVSRLAEQDFYIPSMPTFPTSGVSGLGHLSGHGRGGGCF
jgi:hypothetical protein